MPNESAVFDTFADLSVAAIRDVWMPTLQRMAFNLKRSWFVNRVPRNSQYVGKNLKVNIPFLTGYGSSWRPMSAMGFTPTGSPIKTAKQYAQLGCHAGAIQVNLEAIKATGGDASLINGIMSEQMTGLMETFPYYIRALFWTPNAGILGQAVSISGLVVTLDNVGLWNTATTDRAKLFEPGMFVQTLTSAFVKKGNPVEITGVDKKLGKITLASDPGIADNDVFVLSDIAGLENGYNVSGPGIFDAIDDDNTFQGVNRSLAENAKFRAVVTNANNVAPTFDLLDTFFYDCYEPETAFTNHKVIKRYWDLNVKENIRYTMNDVSVKDGYRSIMIGKTTLVEDEDSDCDKIVVPDFKSLSIQEDPAGIQNLFGKGWQQIQGRPFMEYIMAYWATLMVGGDCRKMGRLDNVSITAGIST
jgi:hypothetical protein